MGVKGTASLETFMTSQQVTTPASPQNFSQPPPFCPLLAGMTSLGAFVADHSNDDIMMPAMTSSSVGAEQARGAAGITSLPSVISDVVPSSVTRRCDCAACVTYVMVATRAASSDGLPNYMQLSILRCTHWTSNKNPRKLSESNTLHLS